MKLDKMPDEGRVVVAHPSCEASARLHARIEGLDHVVSDLCPPGTVYVMDLDQIAFTGGRS